MNRFAASLAMLMVTSGCASSKPTAVDSANGPACVGGFMAQRGLTPWPTCIIPYTDGGKQCSDKADCQGQCLIKYSGDFKTRPLVGAIVSGQCQAEEPAIGCYAQVRQGSVADDFLCTD